MAFNIRESIYKLFNPDIDYDEITVKAKNKVNKSYGLTQGSINPFLRKDGSLRNKYINYQELLDDPKTNEKTKEFITKATGLVSTKKEEQNNSQQKTSSSIVNTNTELNTANSNSKLGYVSAKYESGGYDGGRISTGQGDYGGVSYGISQFATNTGSADAFVTWLKKNNPQMGSYFGSSKAGSNDFSNAWKKVYQTYGDEFSNMQAKYTYENYCKPLVDLAKKKTGIDYSRSPALLELVYSTAVQFGSGSLGLSALGNVNSNMSDEEIINASYDKKISNYKGYYKSSSAAVQEAVKNRFISERKDVLALIGK